MPSPKTIDAISAASLKCPDTPVQPADARNAQVGVGVGATRSDARLAE
jgi:hypothetical protein